MTTTPIADQKQPENPRPSRPADGEACPNCGSVKPWGPASWCPDCGFYPALGGTSLRSAEDVEKAQADAWAELNEGPANLLEAIPLWAWPAIAGSFFILIMNVFARFALKLEASHRTLITLLEFSTGIITAALAHGSTYLFAACKTDKFGPFDYFMKPIEIWKPTFKAMPDGAKRFWAMCWGLVAMFCALFVISGFSFDSLFDDWGFEKREPGNVVHEVVKKARKKRPADDDLEGAIKKFVGEGEPEEEPELLETQCVVIGYTLNEEGQLNSVILASAPRGRLAYVGLLSQVDVPEENRPELLEEFQTVKELKDCYIKQGVPIKEAIWLEPKILCRIEHKSWTTNYTLQQPTFLKIVRPEEEKKSAGDKKEPDGDQSSN